MVSAHRTRGLAALGLALAMTGFTGPPSFAAPPIETTPNPPSSVSTTTNDVDDERDAENCPQLELAGNWYGDNAEVIQATIDQYGRCSWPDGAPPEDLPYAIFDWDNTVVKNDISDQTIFWMLRNDKILQPPERNWHYTSRYMTIEAAEALRQACGALAEPGEPLPTSTNVECADEILSVRTAEETTDGDRVFYGENQRYMKAMYAWVGQIMQGYTPAEVVAIAAEAREAALNAPIGSTQQVGSSTETAWVRYYPEMKDLIETLKRAGIEPWIITASPKEFADAWGPGVGVDSAHTIGVLQLLEDGKLTGHLQGCGGLPDGSDAIMTYIDGKRCFMNQEILGIEGVEGLSPAPEAQRPILGAGDSTTDLSMVRDAVGVRIAINRNNAELMCNAYDNADGRWVVNPMFIEPLPKMEGTYPCSTDAAVDGFGNPGPALRDDGSVIPDQEDTVFGQAEPTPTPTPTATASPTP
ncbi:MAG: HAD family hydrolase, partial [Arachnia sp.]